ncbi:MAG: excinuclease ABC subunit UvrA [Bacteroidota bacterium]
MTMVKNSATTYNIDKLDPKKFIIIKGARVNNLKNLSVAIPRNKLVVITGLSGSGKSSLAFDTLFAEGQRMYVESLSAYARQFLGRMEKPEVDYIKGVSPAISIEQRVNTRNPRSTVGTSTEIYDYLKLLFARIGTTYSPISGNKVTRNTVSDVVDYVLSFKQGEKYIVCCPLIHEPGRSFKKELEILLSKGYTRLIVNGEIGLIEDFIENPPDIEKADILIDRGVIADDEDSQFRLADSVKTAFFEGHGACRVQVVGQQKKEFSDKFELDGISFEEPSANLFTFNNPYGACKKCEGFGNVLGVDPDLVIPDKSLSVYEGAVAPWRSEAMKKWLRPLLEIATDIDFPIHRPFKDLSEEQQKLLWKGTGKFKGIDGFFKFLESKTIKIQYRVMLSRYRGRTVCPDCRGTRLRIDAAYVKINDTSIIDLVLLQVDSLLEFINNIQLTAHEQSIAKRILIEITNRLNYLNYVGLGYLTLNRMTASLSGGEFQRIKLATSLGSVLVGAMYILDEPSIGLHPRDSSRLIEVLKNLRNKGNTVIVVEHEEEIMKSADQLIDIGPDAGAHGGELVFQGGFKDIINADTHTTRYLNGSSEIAIPKKRRKWSRAIDIVSATENNLKAIDAKFPLGVLTVVTGVSGSGKSTLVTDILYPALGKVLGTTNLPTGKFARLEGDFKDVEHIEFVDQNPIGKSSRSNPITYIKAYDGIRALFADQTLAKQRGFKPAHFSFNVEGGRCEVCAGEGVVKIEMQFMADIHLTCDNCKGQRFKREVLDITYKNHNISQVLNLTVEEALTFFEDKSAISSRLQSLYDVGLGYIKLGQSSSSLSGGEAQRVKLASYLGKGKAGIQNFLLIFDEPTTGLHFYDIQKLLDAINALVDQGNTVIVIEHNMEIIKSADWVVDLGPEGGNLGGEICFGGTPENLIKLGENHTARYLKEKFSNT